MQYKQRVTNLTSLSEEIVEQWQKRKFKCENLVKSTEERKLSSIIYSPSWWA